MNTQDENVTRNPFPEPQTIPAGWDTSVFVSAQQDDVEDMPSDTQADQ
jgi:hypothetical protein